MADRINPHVNVRRLVCNKSSRSGAKPVLIVIHATQSAEQAGVSDLQGVGSWFDNPAAQASSHVCTDGQGHSARFVRDEDKAWHVASFNRVSLGIEQIGFAEYKRWAEAELRETARWIARWSVLHGIPIQKAHVDTSAVRVIKAGVIRHSELGKAGGGHFDPDVHRGDYPLHEVLVMAREYRRRLLA